MSLLKGLFFIILIPFMFVFSLLKCILTTFIDCILFVIAGDDYDQISCSKFLNNLYSKIFDFWCGLLQVSKDK